MTTGYDNTGGNVRLTATRGAPFNMTAVFDTAQTGATVDAAFYTTGPDPTTVQTITAVIGGTEDKTITLSVSAANMLAMTEDNYRWSLLVDTVQIAGGPVELLPIGTPSGDSPSQSITVAAGTLVVSGTSTLSLTQMDARYLQAADTFSYRTTGCRVVPIGDSTVVAGTTTSLWADRDIFAAAHWLSGGTFRYVANAGGNGSTAAAGEANFAANVSVHSPDVVPIVFGINDAVAARSVADYALNISTIVGLCRGINAIPMLFTVAPNLNTGAVQQRIADYNDWLRSYASAEGIALVDTNTLLTDPTDGTYLTAYDLDGTHQNETGAWAMAALFNTALERVTVPWPPPLATSATDSNNLMPGLFVSHSAGVGTGWTAANVTPSIVAGTGTAKGNWQRIADLATGTGSISEAVALAPAVAGDVIEFSARVKHVVGTSVAPWRLYLNFGGGNPVIYPAQNVDTEFEGACTLRTTVPAGATQIQVALARVVATVGTGYTQMAQVTVKNLTAQGIV